MHFSTLRDVVYMMSLRGYGDAIALIQENVPWYHGMSQFRYYGQYPTYVICLSLFLGDLDHKIKIRIVNRNVTCA